MGRHPGKLEDSFLSSGGPEDTRLHDQLHDPQELEQADGVDKKNRDHSGIVPARSQFEAGTAKNAFTS
jgi:hypothetical protein